MIAHLVRRIVPLCLTVFLAAPVAASAAPSGPRAHLRGQAGAVCQTVIGVRPGFTLYDNCVDALSRSAERLDEAGAMRTARTACVAQGAAAGPKLAECELARAESTPAAPEATVDAARPGEAAKSWFYASSREMRRREQNACARLGYDPSASDFTSCVAELDAALYAADHPQH